MSFKCIQCKTPYDVREGNFQVSKVTKGGFKNQCINCCTINRKKWAVTHSEKEKERLKEYNLNVRNERRREGRYKESQDNYKDRANELRRNDYHSKKVLKIVKRMMDDLNKYPPPSEFHIDEDELYIPEYNKWKGSKEQQIALVNAGDKE